MYTRDSLFINKNLFYSGDDPASPLSYVHPWVQEPLRRLLNFLPDSVEAVIVYGSALSDFMKLNSDLDLAVISKNLSCLSQKFLKSLNLGIEVDVKVFDSLEDLIDQANNWFPTPIDIVTLGLPVYVKDKTLRME